MRDHRCQRLFYIEVTDYDDDDGADEAKAPSGCADKPVVPLHALTSIRAEETKQLRVIISNFDS